MVSRRAESADATKITPSNVVKLYVYQQDWVLDDARFKLAVKSRQIGFTFATTLRHVRKRIAKGGTTVWVSASERQSREAIEYVKLHLAALQEAFDFEEIEFPGADTRAQQVTLRHNGARIIAMPANPDTMRGFAGDVVLDEFGFHKDAVKIWRAALAIASRGYQVEVISTPNGQAGKYFELCKAAGVPMLGESSRSQWSNPPWSVHYVTLEMAAAHGCPIDPKAMREVAGDEDTYLQEYCCVFLADAENYIPMELVIACESEAATLELPANFAPQGDLFLGGDIGRRKDRTVFWLKEKIGDVKWTRAVITLQRTPFEAQWSILDQLLAMCRRACLDASGLGMHLAEKAVAKYGEGRVEAVTFNLENKERMATLQKKELEERRERIPASPVIRSSFNAVKRFTSTTGHFRFDAERTDAGHADEFWASALSTAAAEGPAPAAMAGCEAPEGMYRAERRGLLAQDRESAVGGAGWSQTCPECGEIAPAFYEADGGEVRRIRDCKFCEAPLPPAEAPVLEVAAASDDRRGRLWGAR